MSDEAFPRLTESSMVAHRKTQDASEIRFVEATQVSQLVVGDLPMDRHFARYVEFVDGLETGGIVLQD